MPRLTDSLLEGMTRQRFRRSFRMWPESYDILEEKIGPHLETPGSTNKKSISVRSKLLRTYRTMHWDLKGQIQDS